MLHKAVDKELEINPGKVKSVTAPENRSECFLWDHSIIKYNIFTENVKVVKTYV
jgi:hypothetical protein